MIWRKVAERRLAANGNSNHGQFHWMFNDGREKKSFVSSSFKAPHNSLKKMLFFVNETMSILLIISIIIIIIIPAE